MAAKKIIYFIAGITPTTAELADIAKLNAACAPAYELVVYRDDVAQSTPIRSADYVGHDAGTIPTEYSAVTVIDPDAIPGGSLLPTQAIVSDAGSLAIQNSAGADPHSVTLTVAASAVTAAKLPATVALVDNADAITVQNSAGAAVAGTHAASVTAGVVANVKLAATIAPVANASNVTVQNSAGTAVPGNHPATVAAGVVSNVKLAATIAPVASGALTGIVATGTGTTVTLTVANGVVTAVALS